MEKHCPYCGSKVKSSDRFCIVCGKPLLSNLPEKKTKNKKELEEEIEELSQNETESEKKKKKKSKGKDKDEDQEEEKDINEKIKPLPNGIKEQIKLNIELKQILEKKKKLDEKLEEYQKAVKSDKYELDYDFAEDITKKLTAAKTVVQELNEKQKEVEIQLEKPFKVQQLKDAIEKKVYQLKNLSKEYKLKKIGKDVFKKLKKKYKQEKIDLDVEIEDLRKAMEMWATELKMDKNDIKSEQRLNKGRYSSKESSEEEFLEKD